MPSDRTPDPELEEALAVLFDRIVRPERDSTTRARFDAWDTISTVVTALSAVVQGGPSATHDAGVLAQLAAVARGAKPPSRSEEARLRAVRQAVEDTWEAPWGTWEPTSEEDGGADPTVKPRGPTLLEALRAVDIELTVKPKGKPIRWLEDLRNAKHARPPGVASKIVAYTGAIVPFIADESADDRLARIEEKMRSAWKNRPGSAKKRRPRRQRRT